MQWDPFSTRAWASTLGMAHVPLFGPSHNSRHPGEHVVLLDGRASSLILSLSTTQDSLIESPEPLSWAWSSYLRHAIIIDCKRAEMVLRQWQRPSEPLRLRIPRSAADVDNLWRDLTSKGRARGFDVVSQMLGVFKSLRANLSAYGADNQSVITLFNILLRAFDEDDAFVRASSRVGDLLSRMPPDELVDSLRRFNDARIDDAVFLLEPSQGDSMRLNPYLLMRHASGYVFQEAHFELERSHVRQLRLGGGLQPNVSTRGVQKRDARFTPPELARSLVEQAFESLPSLPETLTILDPACGSGVFLQEALYELQENNFKGSVIIRGYDISPVSVAIARFCLEFASAEATCSGLRVKWSIEERDALVDQWDCSPSIVVMNPPFTRWEDMDESDKERVHSILGDAAKSRVDKSMAFVWKAVESVSNGAVATVIQSPLLDSRFAEKWRAQLMANCDINVIGRFEGYGYFPGAMVEPAFVVLSKPKQDPPPHPLTAIIAETGSSELALRALRGMRAANGAAAFYVDRDASRSWLKPTSWLPRTFQYADLLDALSESMPKAGDLFQVRQGTLTGNNAVFMMRADRFEKLPKREHKWFRPVAGSPTIRDCRIHRERFVFYPYDDLGQLVLDDEARVSRAVPTFYSERLKPHRTTLQQRRDKDHYWWTLNWPRPFQSGRLIKICTAHFGDAGSFAFDETGEYVVVQWFVWTWRTQQASNPALPLAYLAILNSRLFERLLSCFCPRVSGGQFDLSTRHVNGVFVPDLISNAIPGDVVSDLEKTGRAMSRGERFSEHGLNELVARAYGMPLAAWGSFRDQL